MNGQLSKPTFEEALFDFINNGGHNATGAPTYGEVARFSREYGKREALALVGDILQSANDFFCQCEYDRLMAGQDSGPFPALKERLDIIVQEFEKLKGGGG